MIAVRCLDYSLRMGADITLNSYGGLYADSSALQSAIQAAENKGQLFVTAAGNDYGARLSELVAQSLSIPCTHKTRRCGVACQTVGMLQEWFPRDVGVCQMCGPMQPVKSIAHCHLATKRPHM